MAGGGGRCPPSCFIFLCRSTLAARELLYFFNDVDIVRHCHRPDVFACEKESLIALLYASIHECQDGDFFVECARALARVCMHVCMYLFIDMTMYGVFCKWLKEREKEHLHFFAKRVLNLCVLCGQ